MCRQRHKGMPAFVGFGFPMCRNDTYSLLRFLLCIRYGLYKNEKCICPYLRLTAETKIAIPDGMSLGFKPPA